MRSTFVPYGVYEDIINLLGQWKIMDMKSLKEMCGHELNYHNLLHKVRKLENVGLVKGVLVGRKNKHIFLTNQGLELTPYDSTYEIATENITHDLTVARVLKNLLSDDRFVDGKMFHQIMGNDIYPDAQLTGLKGESTYQLALEIELTQKSKERVKEKFRRYAKGSLFNYVLFVTNKLTLFKAYRQYLKEMEPQVQSAVILVHEPKMSVSKFDYKDCKYLYQNQEYGFHEFF